MNCEECGFAPDNPVEVPAGSFAICWPCGAEHMHVGPHRDGTVRAPGPTINDDPHSPDGVIRYAPDMMRRSDDGRPVAFVESCASWCKREKFPEIKIIVDDPLGLLGADHPKEIVIGGTSEEIN